MSLVLSTSESAIAHGRGMRGGCTQGTTMDVVGDAAVVGLAELLNHYSIRKSGQDGVTVLTV